LHPVNKGLKLKRKNYPEFSRGLADLFPPQLEQAIQRLQKRLAGNDLSQSSSWGRGGRGNTAPKRDRCQAKWTLAKASMRRAGPLLDPSVCWGTARS